MMLPNLIIIGAQKCATTSLHYYLHLHPQISMAREKELNFFILERNWYRGVEWYKSNFTGNGKVYGESSPNYTFYPFFKGVPERMHSVVPDAKLIYVLRDPISRILSNYIHNYTSGNENRPITEVLSVVNNRYICRSKYYLQLEQYLNFFDKSNILIVTLEELHSYRQQTMQKIFKFLDVDDSFCSRKFLKIKHKSSNRRRMNKTGVLLTNKLDLLKFKPIHPGLRKYITRLLCLPFSKNIVFSALDEGMRCELIVKLTDDINRLREYTGYDFEDWSV